MSAQDIAIVAAKRTAIGNFNGTFANTHAHKLGEAVIRDVVNATKIDPAKISEVIMGQILTGGAGMNPARQASIAAGLPKEVPAMVINQVCGSGLKSVGLAYSSIRSGMGQIIIAGGQENMTLAPHTAYIRAGQRMGSAEMQDTMIRDGLTDVFNNYHMGVTAENIAKKHNISREDQDKFSVESQNKAEAAQKSNQFKEEITPVKVMQKKEEVEFAHDEFVRQGVKLEDLAKLRPAFAKEGTVTAGNASGINDGAAVVMVMPADLAQKMGLPILAIIRSCEQAGVEPELMGLGPIPASQKALASAGWKVGDLDLIEANEAFAVQAIAVNQQMGWDSSKVNVNGGAVSLGHPIGASGARILVTLLHEMQKRPNAKKGLATLCIGGGMGISMCVEKA